jgi:hypothetical protein
MSLSDYTEQELALELAKRKLPKQKDLDKINWKPVLKYINECHEFYINNKYDPKDCELIMFELLLKTIYGDSIFSWYNSRDKLI